MHLHQTKSSSPILPGVPEPQNIDGGLGDLITQFVVAYDHPPHIARREFFELSAQLWVDQQLRGAGDELLDDLGRGTRVYRGEEFMQTDEIALGAGGPFQGHGYAGWSRPLAQLSMAL